MHDISKAKRGRPRAFDETAVLDAAIDLFRRNGFPAVSVNDLEEATGLTVGSLYKAYGDKRGIHARALERYLQLREDSIAASGRGADTGRSRLAALLTLYADLSRGEQGRHGCMVVAGIGDWDQLDHARSILADTLARRRAMLAQLIEDGQRDGSVGEQVTPLAAADVLLALLHGMRVVGKAGAFSDDVEGFVAHALRILD